MRPTPGMDTRVLCHRSRSARCVGELGEVFGRCGEVFEGRCGVGGGVGKGVGRCLVVLVFLFTVFERLTRRHRDHRDHVAFPIP